MRRTFWWVLMVCGAALTSGAPPAVARDYPFCIRGSEFGGGGGLGDCSFSTYQQCQATASGLDAYCAENPYFNANAELPISRGRQTRKRF